MKSTYIRYLSQEDILSLKLTSTAIVQALENVLIRHSQGLFQMPPKPAIFPRSGRYDYLHAMPAYVKELDICGLKWLARSSENPKHRDLPQFTGLQVVNDPENGLPLCVMDCRWITVARTTAISVLTARHAAPACVTTMGILGTGLQGRFHALMLAQELPHLRDILVYNRSTDSLEKFITEVAPRLPEKISICATSAKEAIHGSQLTVLTGVNGHFIHLDWLRPGSLCISINLAQALAPDVIIGIDRIFTDDQQQFWDRYRTEPEAFSGKPQVDGELSKLVTGTIKARKNPNDKVLSMNLGMAISDLALGDLVYREALQQNIGVVLPLNIQEDLWPLIG